jgi:hypothetical protein
MEVRRSAELQGINCSDVPRWGIGWTVGWSHPADSVIVLQAVTKLKQMRKAI